MDSSVVIYRDYNLNIINVRRNATRLRRCTPVGIVCFFFLFYESRADCCFRTQNTNTTPCRCLPGLFFFYPVSFRNNISLYFRVSRVTTFRYLFFFSPSATDRPVESQNLLISRVRRDERPPPFGLRKRRFRRENSIITVTVYHNNNNNKNVRFIVGKDNNDPARKTDSA